MIVLLVIFVPILFFIDALLNKWLVWALNDVGLIHHTITFSQACTVTLPLFVMALVAGSVKGVLD